MKLNLLSPLIILLVAVFCQSCGNENTNTTNSDQDIVKVASAMKIKAFNDVDNLVTILSENGIGTLKPWQNPFDTGYGSLTDYYPIGTAKEEYGLTNNLAYYLEGTATTAKNLLINLNLNNRDEKKQGLVHLSNVTTKTFKSLNLKIPDGLIKSIRAGKEFKANNAEFTTSFTLDQSKIETWKVLIISK